MVNLRKIVAVALLLASLISLFSCSTRRTHCEISIDLPSSFTDYDAGKSFDLAYSDGSIIVGILRLSHDACIADSVPTTLSAEKFAEFYRSRSAGVSDLGEVETYGDVAYFTYTLEADNGGKYYYMPTFYTSPFAYFLISFITDYNFREGAKDDIFKYIDSVRLNNNVE